MLCTLFGFFYTKYSGRRGKKLVEGLKITKDLKEISRIPQTGLDGRTVLVTGANGMIATYLIYALMFQADCHGLDIRLIALARNRKKAEQLFGAFLSDSRFTLPPAGHSPRRAPCG